MGNARFWEEETREILLDSGRKLLSQIKEEEGELYSSLQNLIRPLLIIFRQFEDSEEERQQWAPLESQKLSEKLKYEDSKYRMKTRFIGTAAGCVVISLLLPYFPGASGHFFLAAVMVICMYTATPGTRIHGAFVTCFALSMSTLAMKETLAIELRMVYVAAAVLLVLVVNKFFFPTSMGQQFRYNFQMIFHMQHMYLRILERSLTGRLDHGVICDAHIQYHMLHEQVLEYLGKISLKESEYYRQVLDITWKMMAEMEHILFMVNIDRRGVLQEGIMGNYISYTDYVLKFGRLSNDFELYTRTLGEKVTGDYSNFVYSASAEYGRKKDLGNNWYIEPQAQIQYAHVTDADYTTSQDTHVQLDAIDSLIGRVGFRLGKDVGEKSTFYIKADVLHEFLGDQDIEARDATGLLSTTYENEGTWYDIGLGFSHQFSKGTYMYLDMEKSIGNDNEDTYQFNFGMNWKV